jgi:hypothetical protein
MTREEIYLMTRERALGGDKQLMMVRDPRYHGYMITNALMQHFVQMASQRAQRPGIAIPNMKAVRPGSRGRRR